MEMTNQQLLTPFVGEIVGHGQKVEILLQKVPILDKEGWCVGHVYCFCVVIVIYSVFLLLV